MATIIIKNNTLSEISVNDLNGLRIPLSSQVTASDLFLEPFVHKSQDLKTKVSAGDLVINNGTSDLSIANALLYLTSVNYSEVTSPINISLPKIGTPTYSSLNDMHNILHSPGRITGGTISDAGGGTINIASGTGLIRILDDDVSDLKFFNWSASSGVSIPSDTTRYIGVEYNSGSPQIIVKTTDTWNFDLDFPLGIAINESGTLYIQNSPMWVGGSITNVIERFSGTFPLQRDEKTGGLILGETGTRNITVSAGKLWDRLNEFDITAKNTSTGSTFDRYYKNGSGGFTKQSAQTQWDNLSYDNGTGTLATLTILYYAVQWFYICDDNTLISIYGTNQYLTSALANNEGVPSQVPARCQKTGRLIGRFVFQKSASSATAIQSVFDTVFNSSIVSSHNNLSGLQGGTAGEYYHLTATEHSNLGSSTSVNNNYVFAYDTTTQSVATANTFQDLNFSNNAQINGWTHTTGTNVFACSQSGIYSVTVDINVSKTGGGAATFGFRSLFNATEVVGSHVGINITSSSASSPVSKTFMVNATSGQNLETDFAGNATTVQVTPGPNPGSATTPLSASIIIRRIT